jgi:hypothetical protein
MSPQVGSSTLGAWSGTAPFRFLFFFSFRLSVLVIITTVAFRDVPDWSTSVGDLKSLDRWQTVCLSVESVVWNVPGLFRLR